MYPERTTLIIGIEATGVQLKPDTNIDWSIALPCKALRSLPRPTASSG